MVMTSFGIFWGLTNFALSSSFSSLSKFVFGLGLPAWTPAIKALSFCISGFVM